MKLFRNLYNVLIENLVSIDKRLSSFEIKPEHIQDANFLNIINEVETLVRDSKFLPISEELSRSSFFKEKAKKIRKYYESFEVFLETQQYSYALDNGIDINQPHLKRTFEFAKSEGVSVNMDKDSKVLFVGSGIFPETAFAYVSQFGCSVTCLDYNLQAVYLSTNLIKKRGYQDKIKVLYGDARNFDYNGYTHIAIAVLAQPKNEILSQICNTCKNDVSIICRTVEGLKSLIYEPVEDLFLNHYNLLGKVYGDSNTIVNSIILEHVNHKDKEFIYSFLLDSDIFAVKNFCFNIIKEEYGIDYNPDWHKDLDLLGTDEDFYSRKNKGLFIVVKQNDNIVAVGGLRNLTTKKSIFNMFEKRYSGFLIGSIWRVYVKKELRGKGIGTEIVRILEKNAKEGNYNKIYLHTFANNPNSVNFWKNKGYFPFYEENNTLHMEKEVR